MRVPHEIVGVMLCVALMGCAFQQKTGWKALARSTARFALVENGKATAAIVRAQGDDEAFVRASTGFSNALRTVTGAEIPIVSGAQGNVIRWELIPRTTLLNEDEFQITFPDAKTMLIRASPVSLQWAFNHQYHPPPGGLRFWRSVVY